MKINWAYLKKPSVLIGAVILFFILLFMLNKGGGSGASSGQTVVNSGPTDAQVAAQTQLAMAQIGAGVQSAALQIDYAKSQDQNATALAVAQIQGTLQGQSLQVQREIAAQTVAAQVHGLDLQYQTAVANNSFALDYAQQQFTYGLTSQAINAGLQQNLATLSANTQLQMSQDQLEAYKFGTLTSAIGNLKKSDQDDTLERIFGNPAAMQYNPNYGQSSGFNIMSIVSPISSVF
jgi:hypothetical protein